MSVQELSIALFKEYLVVQGYDLTAASFKTECETKNVKNTITKRLQMIEILNLKDQVIVETRKKKEGQPSLLTTLEILIHEFVQNDQTIKQLKEEKKLLEQKLNSQQNQQELDVETQKKKVKKIKKQDQVQEKPEDNDNIWNMPSQKNQKQNTQEKTNQTIVSSISNYQLNQYICDACGDPSRFYLTLFNDKRVKAVSDNWYQGLCCTSIGQSMRTEDPRTWAIHQEAGGPCGFIAVTQARAYKYLFCGAQPKISNKDIYKQSILNSLYDTFVTIAPENYVMVLPQSYDHQVLQLDRIIEEIKKFVILRINTQDELKKFMSTEHFARFCFQGGASSFVPCMVFSFIFTRGIDNIQNLDFDKESASATGSIFANHNNCSQELVNLMICGRAVAGIHDKILNLDGLILQGIPQQCDIGLVSIFEAYNYLIVGTNLKVPKYPCWVCFNEAHFTAIFADASLLQVIQRHIQEEDVDGETILTYYDGLDDQKAHYKIKVKYSTRKYKKKETESFVENLIQTLLPAISFDWCGNDKLL